MAKAKKPQTATKAADSKPSAGADAQPAAPVVSPPTAKPTRAEVAQAPKTEPSAAQASAKQPSIEVPGPKSSRKASGKKAATSAVAESGKVAAKEVQKPAIPHNPMIDTKLVAATAASMVVHRDIVAGAAAAATSGSAPAEPQAARPESASFKQLKQGLNKPASSVGNLLGSPAGQKKSNLPFGGGKQSFRNQTFGADVNRSGVPRRTGG